MAGEAEAPPVPAWMGPKAVCQGKAGFAQEMTEEPSSADAVALFGRIILPRERPAQSGDPLRRCSRAKADLPLLKYTTGANGVLAAVAARTG